MSSATGAGMIESVCVRECVCLCLAGHWFFDQEVGSWQGLHSNCAVSQPG